MYFDGIKLRVWILVVVHLFAKNRYPLFRDAL